MNRQQLKQNWKEHNATMLRALGIDIKTKHMTDEQIREAIEKGKIEFLRKLQRAPI